MDPALRLQSDQSALTPAQEAEARRFAQERIQAQLSTEPVDEQEAERWLRQAYQAAGLAAPQQILWLDGPLQLVAVLGKKIGTVEPDSVLASVWASLEPSVEAAAVASVGAAVVDSVWAAVRVSLKAPIRAESRQIISADLITLFHECDRFADRFNFSRDHHPQNRFFGFAQPKRDTSGKPERARNGETAHPGIPGSDSGRSISLPRQFEVFTARRRCARMRPVS